LESFLTKSPQAGWQEFVQAVMVRFMRNQHQILLRRLFRISQTDSVEDYVQRFSDLVDQISAYEPNPDSLRNLTRFLDGLKPAVRVLVAIQQPDSLDAAFTMALLYEELGDGSNPLNLQSTYRVHRQPVLPPPPPLPPTKWVSRSVEAKKQSEHLRPSSDDRWTSLKAYRKARGLCYVCGERWGRDHQCKGAVPLHLVQEMLDYMQLEDEITCPDDEPVPEQLL
jgi:hypothetical protein